MSTQQKLEKDNSPLLEAEISRLIKVSRETGYKKQDQIPHRDLADFKPMSINNIATQISQQYTQSQPNKKSDNIEKEEQSKTELESLQEQKEQQVIENEPSSIETKVDELEEQKQNVGESPDNTFIEQEALSSMEDNNVNVESKQSSQTNSTNTAEDEDPIEKAKQEGIEIGKNLAHAEILKDQKEVIETLRTTINNIRAKETIDKSALFDSILEVVSNLASDRAGMMIDDSPEIFKDKIFAFVAEIEKEAKKITLNLNPRDAAVIKKISKKTLSDEDIEIKDNSELLRGDFILQMGTIEMGNLISKQINMGETESEENIQSEKYRENNELEVSDKDINKINNSSNKMITDLSEPEKDEK